VPNPGTVSGKAEIFAATVLTCFEDSREIADTNKDPSTTRSTILMLARLTSTDENEAAAGTRRRRGCFRPDADLQTSLPESWAWIELDKLRTSAEFANAGPPGALRFLEVGRLYMNFLEEVHSTWVFL
jgi:hypothetical protein